MQQSLISPQAVALPLHKASLAVLIAAVLLLPFRLEAQTTATDSLRATVVVVDTCDTPLPLLVKQRLDSLTADSLLETSQLGLMVWDLDADSALYRLGHRQLLRTASTMKLVTAITALTRLGGDYELATNVYYDGTISHGQLRGDLICVGGMDPMFDRNDLRAIVKALRAKGVKAIKGRIVTDLSMKDDNKWGEGWCWDDDNPTLSPLLIDGKADFSAQLLQELRRQRINTAGVRVAPGSPGPQARLLCRRSHQLREVLIQMMKESDNLYAECVFYQTARIEANAIPERLNSGTPTLGGVGSYKSGTPTLGGVGSYSATATDGAASAQALLDTLGLPASRYRLADGSGLSLYNYLSAEAQIMLLRHAWNSPSVIADLMPSLPIAGEDGTLKNRMTGDSPAHLNVRAKTGTVTGVSALAGYCTAANDHHLCFAIINQGIRRAAEGRQFQDRLCEALCAPCLIIREELAP